MNSQTGISLPILYSFRRCPYAMRARSAIAVSGQACELREVVLKAKPTALLEASPKATVPVLVDTEGHVIDQSLDIMLWALRRNDPDAWLAPEQGSLQGMLALVEECDGPFKCKLDRYKYPQRYQEVSGKRFRDEAAIWLDCLNARLADQACLFGGRPALADMAIAPFVRQFAHVDLSWFQAQPWPRLQRWLSDWKESGLFQTIMAKHPPWQDGDRPTRFP